MRDLRKMKGCVHQVQVGEEELAQKLSDGDFVEHDDETQAELATFRKKTKEVMLAANNTRPSTCCRDTRYVCIVKKARANTYSLSARIKKQASASSPRELELDPVEDVGKRLAVRRRVAVEPAVRGAPLPGDR